jgi:hypothetical protein
MGRSVGFVSACALGRISDAIPPRAVGRLLGSQDEARHLLHRAGEEAADAVRAPAVSAPMSSSPSAFYAQLFPSLFSTIFASSSAYHVAAARWPCLMHKSPAIGTAGPDVTVPRIALTPIRTQITCPVIGLGVPTAHCRRDTTVTFLFAHPPSSHFIRLLRRQPCPRTFDEVLLPEHQRSLLSGLFLVWRSPQPSHRRVSEVIPPPEGFLGTLGP